MQVDVADEVVGATAARERVAALGLQRKLLRQVLERRQRRRLELAAVEQQALEVLTLRVGVREGGCGDFSYFMDQMKPDEQVDAADTVVQVGDGTRCAIDSKSLRLVAGTRLDYSDDGGFSFSNPNAKSTCGCGNSFDAAG